MGIDRIGNKGPPPAPSPEKAVVDRPSEAGAPFEIGSSAKTETRSPSQPASIDPPRAALERYRAGEIDFGRYLDLKVDEATAHLAALPAQDLQAIRSGLRDRLASDPTLIELVRTATGHVPDPLGDE
jgi:hypothetical protein